MPHTKASWICDNGFADGKIVFGVQDIFVQAGAGTVTRNAAGDISINQGNTQAGIFVIPINTIVERAVSLGVGLDLQEQFGTAAGVSGPSAVANTSDPAAQKAGRPAGNATATQLTPLTGFIPKGIQINDITLVYSIGTADLTTHTIRVDKATYVDNVAVAVTAILAVGNNGLIKVQRANPYVTKVAIAGAAYNVTDNSDLIAEVAATTPGTGTYRFYRGILHCTFNFN